MPARSITNATERSPISRYGVCCRCSSASIIEFSKCVRRHQVTNELTLPCHPLARRNGVAASTRPACMSTTVPYWSNMQTVTVDFMSCATVMVHLASIGPCAEDAARAKTQYQQDGDEADHGAVI